jgi:hypothetical protein
VTDIPSIYGDDLSEPAKAAYARWMAALFDLTEHRNTCPLDCKYDRCVCPEGQRYYDTEQQRHHELRAAVRDAEVTT